MPLMEQLKLRLLLTNRCTARCAYCHNEGQNTEGHALLNLEMVKDILQQLQILGVKPQEFILSGGEPTLHKDVAGIARLCQTTGAHISMDSHLGHPVLLKKALPFVNELKVHLDSFDADIQYQSMRIHLADVLHSLKIAKQFPNLDIKLNHPMGDFIQTAQFIKQARLLNVNCKIIELFQQDHSIPLNTINWKALGYQQHENYWLHQNGAHKVYHKRCDAESNRHENTLFIGVEGIRFSVDGDIMMTLDELDLANLLPRLEQG